MRYVDGVGFVGVYALCDALCARVCVCVLCCAQKCTGPTCMADLLHRTRCLQYRSPDDLIKDAQRLVSVTACVLWTALWQPCSTCTCVLCCATSGPH